MRERDREAAGELRLTGSMFRLRAGSHGPGVRKYLACFRDRFLEGMAV